VLTSRQPYPVPAQHPTDQTYALSLHDALPIWSDFIEARYAFSFVLANFGIAIAAKMPMITTTIISSMSVKPLRFICTSPCFRGRRAKSRSEELRVGKDRRSRVMQAKWKKEPDLREH